MFDTSLHSPLVLLLATAAIVTVAGLLPASPGDALLVAVAAAAPPSLLLALVPVATAGHMAAKTAVYRAGCRAPRAIPPRHRPRFERARARLAGRRGLQRLVVLASSATSLPPFYLVTALAGTLGLPLRDFLLAGSVGAAIRFTALLSLPRLLSLAA